MSRQVRLFYPNLILGSNVTLGEEESHYLRQVLRLEQEAAVELFCGDGYNYPFRVSRTGRRVELTPCGAPQPGQADPRLIIDLVVALPKGLKLDDTIAPCTALGVSAIFPVSSHYAEGGASSGKLQRWAKIAQSAAAQCGRTTVPSIAPPVRELAQLLPQVRPQGERGEVGLVGVPGEAVGTNELRAAFPEPPTRVVLLVGPEGGWHEAEITAATEAGFRAWRLGPRILRAELFPLAALAVLQYLWGDS